MFQLCDQHSGANGGRGLYDCLSQWSHTPQKNAWSWLAKKVLSDDWQKVRPFIVLLESESNLIFIYFWRDIIGALHYCINCPDIILQILKKLRYKCAVCLTCDILNCVQAQEEFEIFHHCSSIMVYQDCSSHYQALHKVNVLHQEFGWLCMFSISMKYVLLKNILNTAENQKIRIPC